MSVLDADPNALTASWFRITYARDGKKVAAPFECRHSLGMFAVTEADASQIRAAFERGGELCAAAELRRLFPGISDTAQLRECARTIAAWRPVRLPPYSRPRRRNGKV